MLRSKGGVKLHTVLDYDSCIPSFVELAEAKASDIVGAGLLVLPPPSIITADRGYFDSSWFSEVTSARVIFLTRLKREIRYGVSKRDSISKKNGLSCDQTIHLTGRAARKISIKVRRIRWGALVTGKHYACLGNFIRLAVRTAAEIYCSGCQVELLFRWIKQNLKIESFPSTSFNAVVTQIWMALIIFVHQAYLKFKSELDENLSRIHKLIQTNLFNGGDLIGLLDPNSVVLRPPQGAESNMLFNKLWPDTSDWA